MMPFAGMTSLSFGVGGKDFRHGLYNSRRLGAGPQDCNHSQSVCPAGLGPEQRYKASRVDMIRSRLRGMS